MNRQRWRISRAPGHDRRIHDNARRRVSRRADGTGQSRGWPGQKAERGEPTDPNSDHYDWKRLLVKAGPAVSAATRRAAHGGNFVLILGVPERTVIGLMGWLTTPMAAYDLSGI